MDNPARYSITIEIKGLPKTINAMGRKHWLVKAKEAKIWRQAVVWSIGFKRPPRPLERVRVEYTRFSSREPDYDGLVSSFKHVQDGLKDAKVIIDDKSNHIVERSYLWVKVPNGKGKIRVVVTELPGPENARKISHENNNQEKSNFPKSSLAKKAGRRKSQSKSRNQTGAKDLKAHLEPKGRMTQKRLSSLP